MNILHPTRPQTDARPTRAPSRPTVPSTAHRAEDMGPMHLTPQQAARREVRLAAQAAGPTGV